MRQETSATPVTGATVVVGDVPLHDPLQPEKVWPLPGAAVKVTTVCAVNRSVHVASQSSPAGRLVTRPAAPWRETVSACHSPVGGFGVATNRPAA